MYATKKPADQTTAENQRSLRLISLACPHAVGSSASQTSPACSRGAIQYVTIKLREISTPEMLNVQILWRDKLTSQGIADNSEATVVPRPSNTSTAGRAQQSSVPNELKSEK
jgi:hypothetical protein